MIVGCELARLDESLKPADYQGGLGRGAKIPMQTRADMGLHSAVPPKRGNVGTMNSNSMSIAFDALHGFK